jgi:RNase P/RNase MRP subunit p30
LEEACVKHLNVRLEHLFDDSIQAALSRTIEAMEAMEREVKLAAKFSLHGIR